MPNNVRIGIGVVDKASSELDRIKDKFTKLQSAGAKGILQGVGIAAGITAFHLLGTAVSAATDFLFEGIRAAKEDEVSVAKLGAALKANIPNWDGNTAAIEKIVKAHIDLGFADDDTRASLALLVGSTHDVNKAFAIQNTAMDLARFKNISLADASSALVKVEAGQYRGLKALGIVLKDGATQAEALAAVQQVVSGQAAAYAQTIEGKTLVAQLKLNETEERFGRAVMPLVSSALSIAADSLDAFNDILDQVNKTSAEGTPVAKSFGDTWLTSIGDILKAMQDAPWPIGTKDMPDWAAFDQGAARAAKEAEAAALRMTHSFDPKEMKTTMTAFYQPVWHQFDVAAFKAEQAAADFPGVLARGIRSGLDDIKSAMDDLRADMKLIPKERAELLGQLYSKALAKGMRSGNPYIKAEAAAIRLHILQQLAAHYFYTGGVNAGRSFTRGLARSTSGNTNPNIRAEGGPVSAKTPYLVGEKGMELFVPEGNGTIIPHDKVMAAGGGGSPVGGGAVTIIINPPATWSPAMARSFGDVAGPSIYDYLYRRGAVGRAS